MVNTRTLLLLIDLIDLARLASTQGVDAANRFDAQRAKIRTLIAAGCNPAVEVHAALAADLAVLRQRLREE